MRRPGTTCHLESVEHPSLPLVPWIMKSAIEKSGSFVASHFKGPGKLPGLEHPVVLGPAITIAHQTGSGEHEIAQRLAQLLQGTEPKEAPPWTVLDREILEKALEEHHWPRALAQKMPEDKRSYLDDTLDDLFGLRPPSWVLVPQVVETIQRLAEAGHVILIGRGATLVTLRISNVFRVRLIASLATRIQRVQQSLGLTAEAAAQMIRKEDRGRRRYIRANFHARLEDEQLYHLVVNTDRLSCADAAIVIAEGAKRCFGRASQAARVESRGGSSD